MSDISLGYESISVIEPPNPKPPNPEPRTCRPQNFYNMPINTSFADFVNKFPIVELPVILGEETHHVFSAENEPLSDDMIQVFIESEYDELTEYIPCFSLNDTERFIALVWWKAGLLNYEYTLATFNERGEAIDRKVIAYTRVENGQVARGVTTINEEHEIIIAEGSSADGNDLFDPTTVKNRFLELMDDGSIV